MKPVDKNDNCAQMTIDYIAGMGIFLIAVAFVFQFIYGLFIPFQSSSEAVTLAADRASTILVERLLIADKSGASNVIDQGKLDYFINIKLNSHSNPQAYDDALHELGLFSRETYTFDLNVSVSNLTNPDVPMSRGGPVIPEKTSIGQTTRFVMVVNTSTGYNETAIISVRVW